MKPASLIPHLFRNEFSRMVAVLVKYMGLHNLEAAEDIVSESFLAAMETWPYKGVPPNPVAWLYTVAKNKAKNRHQRQTVFDTKVVPQLLQQADKATEMPPIDLSEKSINDSQLQMLFAVCNPLLSQESQIGLALRVLCGFGLDEIANALLSNRETIHKRLTRAKEKLREAGITLTVPGKNEIAARLDTVLTTLYLLFNEGYYSETNDAVIRKELCAEAMRLTYLLVNNPDTGLPKVKALLSLMCFHSSRLDARETTNGSIILYDEQDETRWNRELIGKGVFYMHEAASGNQLSSYHLEACIAYWHTVKNNTKEKWQNILNLYNLLLKLEYSPIAALNRSYALYMTGETATAIGEAEKLQLIHNRYYHCLLGELYSKTDKSTAALHFEKALQLAKTRTDKEIIRKKLSKFSD